MDDRIDEGACLAELFEEHRWRLRAVAYRMLGSLSEADDAVQDAWIRFSRSGTEGVDNVAGLLTTIVARVCLNKLRARNARREVLAGVHVPDPVITREDPLLGRSPAAARQLASRARHRVQDTGVRAPDADLGTQRALVNAFFAAARGGDFDGLVSLLDPDVVLRADGGAAFPQASVVLHGAEEVASQALVFVQPAAEVRHVLINGAAGVVVTAAGRPAAVIGFTISGGRITEINGITDPGRLSKLAATIPGS